MSFCWHFQHCCHSEKWTMFSHLEYCSKTKKLWNQNPIKFFEILYLPFIIYTSINTTENEFKKSQVAEISREILFQSMFCLLHTFLTEKSHFWRHHRGTLLDAYLYYQLIKEISYSFFSRLIQKKLSLIKSLITPPHSKTHKTTFIYPLLA